MRQPLLLIFYEKYDIINEKESGEVEIFEIYDSARRFMYDAGNPNQWGKTNPPRERTETDLREENLYVVEIDNDIFAVFYYKFADDPTYKIIYNGEWLNEKPYGVIHRIAVSHHRMGVAEQCYRYALHQCRNLRIDTHHDNIPMQRSLEKNGFQRCGIIHLANGDPRIAYQKTAD